MKLTKKQKEALDEAPLYFGQSEDNMNVCYWTNGNNDKWWQPRTIQILIDKNLLSPKYNRLGSGDDNVLYRVDENNQ